jgi:hypothetical protein
MREKRAEGPIFGDASQFERVGEIRARWEEEMGAVCSRKACQYRDGE